jgi:hypothetical protein
VSGRIMAAATLLAVVISSVAPAQAQTRRPGGDEAKCNQLGSVAACVKCAISRGFPPSRYEPYCGVKK